MRIVCYLQLISNAVNMEGGKLRALAAYDRSFVLVLKHLSLHLP